MSLIILIIIVIVCLAIIIYGIQQTEILQAPWKSLVILLVCLLAVLIILARAGLLGNI